MAKYTYEEFLNIIATLRGDNGCPWDREQTHMSLRPCMMEEAAEVMAGIRTYEETGDADNLREELGDVLLQVVMHAQIAKEEGVFTMEDVVSDIAEKMVRRHPHVFGEVVVKDSGQVLDNWEEIKKQEKKGKREGEFPLREIPEELPALAKSVKVLKKVDKYYEKGADYQSSIRALEEIVDQLKKTEPVAYSEDVAEGVTDALLAIANLSRICKLSPEQLLSDRIYTLIAQYETIN